MAKAERKREFQSQHIEVVKGSVPNPNWSRDHAGARGNPKFIDAQMNAKESAISVLASKKAIDECQAEAAIKFRRLFETIGGKGASAIDYSKELVDGGGFAEAIGDWQIDAGRKLSLAHKALTGAHGAYAWRVIMHICGEGRSIHELTRTRRERDTMTDMLRLYLDCLANHWNLSTGKNISDPIRPFHELTSRA